MEPIIAGPVITQLSNFFGIFDVSLNTPEPVSSWAQKCPLYPFPFQF